MVGWPLGRGGLWGGSLSLAVLSFVALAIWSAPAADAGFWARNTFLLDRGSSLTNTQTKADGKGGGVSTSGEKSACGALCQARELIMGAKKAINAQADAEVRQIRGGNKSAKPAASPPAAAHHRPEGKLLPEGKRRVSHAPSGPHGRLRAESDGDHVFTIGETRGIVPPEAAKKKLWSDVLPYVRKAVPLHDDKARQAREAAEKAEETNWLTSGAHVAETPEERAAFGRVSRKGHAPQGKTEGATGGPHAAGSQLSSGSSQPATSKDLQAFVREVEKAGGIDAAVRRIARAKATATGLGRHHRTCTNNPHWRNPFGEDCVKYAYGGDRNFWCEWDGASRLDACPAACGTCTVGMLRESMKDEKAVEKELSEHYAPQTLVRGNEDGMPGPKIPQRVEARREGRAILEGEVSSLKRRLRGMVGALSPDHATGVAARQDMDHFYDSQQGETGRGGSKETAGKASRNVGGGYPGGPQRDQSVRGVTGAKRGSSSRGLLVGWWKPDVDGSGRAFWYNRALGETSWSNPNESKKPSSGGEGLSKG